MEETLTSGKYILLFLILILYIHIYIYIYMKLKKLRDDPRIYYRNNAKTDNQRKLHK